MNIDEEQNVDIINVRNANVLIFESFILTINSIFISIRTIMTILDEIKRDKLGVEVGDDERSKKHSGHDLNTY